LGLELNSAVALKEQDWIVDDFVGTLLEEMVLFRSKNGSIPRFIYEMVLYRTIFLVKGSIGQVWNLGTLF